MTALMMAALKGNTANIHSLLECKADANMCNILGQSALDIATAMGHEQVAEMLMSDNEKLNKQVPALSTEITFREMGLSKTYMLTEENEACTTQSEEPSSQLRDFSQHTQKISQNLCLLGRSGQSLQFAGPRLQFCTHLDDVAASSTSTSFSLQRPNVTPKICSPKIEYCMSCCSHHPPDISQCLKKKSSNISKSDALLPVHNTCQLDSIISKPQSKTETVIESFRHKPSFSGPHRFSQLLSEIKKAFKFKTNVRRIFNTSRNHSVRRRTDSPPSNKYVDQSTIHTDSSADTALSPLRNLDVCHSNLEASRLPSRTPPHINTQTCHNTTQTYRSRVRVTSPQSNTGISHSRTQAFNGAHRGLSPHNNTCVLETICQPSTRDSYTIEEGYKIASIPCSLYQPSDSTQDIFFQKDKHKACSYKRNIDTEHSKTQTYSLPNSEFSPLRNIGTHTVSSRTHTPLSNTKTYSLPDTACSSFSSTEPYGLSYPSRMDIHSVLDRILSALSNKETYSLPDRAFPSQSNSHTGQNNTKMCTILNRANSPVTNLRTYSSADRVRSPVANLQTYSSVGRVLSPVANLQAYSSADRVLSPVAYLHAYSSADRVLSPVANLQTHSSADRQCSPVANLHTYSSADRQCSPAANLTGLQFSRRTVFSCK
jgi:hypothetical protein